jgi:7tm Chemosensory receptor
MEEKSDSPPPPNPNPVNLVTEVFAFQRFSLQVFGFAPSSLWQSRLFRAIMWLISLVVLMAAVTELVYQIAVLVSEIRKSSLQAENNLVLTVLSSAPYIAQSMRGVFVLIILISNRKSWRHLAHFADEIVNETFPEGKERKAQSKRWKNFAVTIGVGTVLLHLGWEAAALLGDQDSSPFWSSSNSSSSTSKPTVDSLMESKLMYCLSSVAESIPFILSQQIFVIVIVLAFVLKTSAKVLNQRITDLREETEVKVSGEAERQVEVVGWEKPKFSPESEVRQVNTKAAALQEFHLRLILLNQEINHVFGWVLFILYSMDVVILIGFVALLVTSEKPAVATQTLHITSIALFGCFSTIFYVPMVQAHEEVRQTQ